MEIAEMVLNKVNKSLVTMVEELGVKAVGVSGKDGGLLQVEKKYSNGQDIGYVGEITGVNPDILFDMLEKDYLPLSLPLDWTRIITPTISMRMMRPALSQKQYMRRNWHF